MFDEGNYVVLFQDTHTGQRALWKPYLHNTKIFRLNINEQKAYKQVRRNNRPSWRDIPHFQMSQIILGHPEVFTNIELGADVRLLAS